MHPVGFFMLVWAMRRLSGELIRDDGLKFKFKGEGNVAQCSTCVLVYVSYVLGYNSILLK